MVIHCGNQSFCLRRGCENSTLTAVKEGQISLLSRPLSIQTAKKMGFFVIQLLLAWIVHLIANDPVVADAVPVCDGMLPVELSMLQPEHYLIRRTERRHKL